MNKKKIILIVAIVMSIVLVIAGVSYAFFASNITNDSESNYNVSFDEKTNFTVTNASISLNVTEANMLQNSTDVIGNEANATIGIKLSSEGPTTCNYDVYFSWDSSSDEYLKTTGATNEYTVQINNEEVQLPNYGTGELKLYSSDVKTSDGSEVNKTHLLYVRFYNLHDFDQSGHSNKNYKGTIAIKNVVCSEGVSE